MNVFKRLVLFGAAAVLAIVAVQWTGSRTKTAQAFPNVDNFAVAGQTCLADGTVSLNFSWTAYNQGNQWFDLTLFDNGFAPGTFIGLGPLPSNQSTFTWNGLKPGLLHFIRLNTFVNSTGIWAPTV